MKFHAQNLPTTGDAVVLALDLVDRGLSVVIEWSEEKQWTVAAMGDATPKPEAYIDPDKERRANSIQAKCGYSDDIERAKKTLSEWPEFLKAKPGQHAAAGTLASMGLTHVLAGLRRGGG